MLLPVENDLKQFTFKGFFFFYLPTTRCKFGNVSIHILIFVVNIYNCINLEGNLKCVTQTLIDKEKVPFHESKVKTHVCSFNSNTCIYSSNLQLFN